MSIPGRLRLALVLALALAAPCFAQEKGHPVLVLKDGRRMTVKSFETKGPVTNVVDLSGAVVVVKTDLIDFEKTNRATEAAMRPATPTPTPVKKKSIVEVAREMQERRRHGGSDPVPGIPEKTPPAVTPAPSFVLPAPTVAVPVAAATSPAVPAAAQTPTPAAEATPAVAPSATPVATPTPAPLPAEEPGMSPLLLYGGIAGAVVLVALGLLLALKGKGKGKAKPKPGKKAGAAADEPFVPARADAEEELLTPAFARDDSAEDLPIPLPVSDEEISSPAELTGAGGGRKALTSGGDAGSGARAGTSGASAPVPFPTGAPADLPQAAPGILEEGREVQIRIGADVYTCPDLATLRRWVEEGRVIETSEILAPDGSWLMAGSIPDLESAFERRRETLGY